MESLLVYLKKERDLEWRVELRNKIKAKDRTNLERLDMPEEDPDIRNKLSLIHISEPTRLKTQKASGGNW